MRKNTHTQRTDLTKVLYYMLYALQFVLLRMAKQLSYALFCNQNDRAWLTNGPLVLMAGNTRAHTTKKSRNK